MTEKSKRLALRYFGHSAFQWITPQGARVLIDPYRPMDPYHDDEERMWYSEMGKWFVKEFPLVETDLVLVTHPHFDHAAVDRILGLPTIIRTPCCLQYKDVKVQGFKDFHARYHIVNKVHNIIFLIEVAGLRFCHLGDNRSRIPADIYNNIGRVDVLMISVDDSCHLLTYKEINHVISQLNPLIVIPMHYLIPGITTLKSTLKTPKEWLRTQPNVYHLQHDIVHISLVELPKKREVWTFS